MPRRSFKKRTFSKRRRYSKKGSRSRYIAAKRRRRFGQTKLLRGPINRTAIAKLRYCESVNLSPGAGFVATNVFRCNDVRDPNYTNIGHQPMGFDELMVNYNHFTVIGSKITVTFTGQTNTYVCGIAVDASSANTSTSGEELKERQRTIYRIMPTNVGGAGKCVLTKRFSAKKFFHVKAIVGESQYKGTASTSPTEQAYFYVWAGADDGTTATQTIQASVHIEYMVVFSEPKTVGQS